MGLCPLLLPLAGSRRWPPQRLNWDVHLILGSRPCTQGVGGRCPSLWISLSGQRCHNSFILQQVAISALQETDGEKDFTCPLFLIKCSTQTVSRHHQPPCFQPGFWTWECPLSERSWTPELALFNAVAGSRQQGFQDGCSHKMKVLYDFSYFLWCRNQAQSEIQWDNLILPCFLLDSGMKVTG